MDNSISFREATINDKDEILTLFKACYAKNEVTEKDPNVWDWEMTNNPEGQPIFGVGISDNRIIAFYAVIPYEYLTEQGELIKIGLVVDVMVHPEYQGKGIFVAIGKYTLPIAVKKLNLKFTIGYPFTGTTYNAVIPGHKKVGWELCDKLNFYMFPINSAKIIAYKFPALKLVSKIAGLPLNILLRILKFFRLIKYQKILKNQSVNVRIQEDIEFTEDDIQLIEHFSTNKFIKKRDRKFLEWRFIKKPDAKYSIIRAFNSDNKTIAFAIVRKYKLHSIQLGIIIDIIGDNEAKIVVVNNSIKYLIAQKCDSVSFLDYKDSELTKIIQSHGFINTYEYYQIINWKTQEEKFNFPKLPHLNFVDFDIF